jgi:hypothetical protein
MPVIIEGCQYKPTLWKVRRMVVRRNLRKLNGPVTAKKSRKAIVRSWKNGGNGHGRSLEDTFRKRANGDDGDSKLEGELRGGINIAE